MSHWEYGIKADAEIADEKMIPMNPDMEPAAPPDDEPKTVPMNQPSIYHEYDFDSVIPMLYEYFQHYFHRAGKKLRKKPALISKKRPSAHGNKKTHLKTKKTARTSSTSRKVKKTAIQNKMKKPNSKKSKVGGEIR